MDFQSLLEQKRKQLKPCSTTITKMDGSKCRITEGKEEHLGTTTPFVVDTKPDLRVSRILDGLFLSSQDPVANLETLQSHSIRHVLSVGIETPVKFPGIQYHFQELLDLPESDIFQTLLNSIVIIHDCLEENILVHCNAGVSRSATVVIAFVMARENCTYSEAFEKVKSCRNSIKPNEGYVRQLKELEGSQTLREILQCKSFK